MLCILFSVSFAQKTEQENLQYPPFQITFFSPLGTNGINCGNVVNKLSFNIISGFANVCMEHKGLQVGGFSNLAIGIVTGNQISGFANVGIGNTTGTQISGFANLSANSLTGLQVGGFSNIAIGDAKGVQISGFANIVANDLTGSQIAGFANIVTGDLIGTQIAGFVNYARDLKGVQVGVVNISKTAEDGIPIGFISVVKEGLKQLEISGGETLHTNIAFKTGVDRFYNIFAFGANFRDEEFRWGTGYGIGSLIKISPMLHANIELMSYQIIEESGNSWRRFWRRNNLNLLNQAKFNFVFNIGPNFSLFTGASFNVMVSEYMASGSSDYGSDISPWHIYDKTRRNTNVKMWPGFNLGLRLNM